jgi:uracil phosphoribosyltransferase
VPGYAAALEAFDARIPEIEAACGRAISHRHRRPRQRPDLARHGPHPRERARPRPSARVGFIGLYRDEETLLPVQYYYKVPDDLAHRPVIVVDPMLATGNSSAAAVDLLKRDGATDLRFLCLLAAPEGVQRMAEAHPDVHIVCAALDERLNEKGYIMPGLGDAGDRMFGTK